MLIDSIFSSSKDDQILVFQIFFSCKKRTRWLVLGLYQTISDNFRRHVEPENEISYFLYFWTCNARAKSNIYACFHYKVLQPIPNSATSKQQISLQNLAYKEWLRYWIHTLQPSETSVLTSSSHRHTHNSRKKFKCPSGMQIQKLD